MKNTIISNGVKRFFIISLLAIALLGAKQSSAASIEKIDSYQVTMEILNDSNILVTETIDYNFGKNQKHGIYRYIPIMQKDLSETPFRVKNIEVYNKEGLPYETSIYRNSDNVNIRVGDEDVLVTGNKTYVISYLVEGAWLFDENTDNLFWNAIGTDWKVDIDNVDINVYLPQALADTQFNDKCYWGEYGSTKECPGAFYIAEADNGNIQALVFKLESLVAGQGATINLSLDKGIIQEPPPPNPIIVWLKKFAWIFVPIIFFGLMFYLWYTRGRDPKGRGTIIAQYDPPKDMMPAEVGTVYDETTHSQDISAEIIHLAIHGYIKIRRIEKKILFSKQDDFLLEKLKEPTDLKRAYQRKLMDKLFASPEAITENDGIEISSEAISIVKLSDLKKKAYKWIKELEKDITDSTVNAGYFDSSPKKIRSRLLLFLILFFGIFIFLISGFGFIIRNFLAMPDELVFAWGFSFVLSFIIIVAFGMAMPRRTIKGVLAKEHIFGLKEYIKVAEQDRIKFHNAPKKDPQVFEKLLPYAMVFKLEKEWAKQFEDIYVTEPSWYVAGQGAHFSAAAFGSSLGDFRSSSAGAMSPSSNGGGAGGGFSGGGAGGGGGGSW